jgi:hypothetical protein
MLTIQDREQGKDEARVDQGRKQGEGRLITNKRILRDTAIRE